MVRPAKNPTEWNKTRTTQIAMLDPEDFKNDLPVGRKVFIYISGQYGKIFAKATVAENYIVQGGIWVYIDKVLFATKIHKKHAEKKIIFIHQLFVRQKVTH